LVEGLLSTCFGLVILAFLPPVPEKLKWGWTKDEKRMAIIRTQWANNTPGAKLRWREVLPAFKSPMFIAWTYILAANQISLAGLSNFMPSIIKGMGYSSVHAQLMTVPIYAASFVSTLTVPYLSDRLSLRGPFVAGLSCFSFIGLIMLIVSHHNPTRYAGAILAATGLYPIVTINVSALFYLTCFLFF
jgi:cyanate permease